MKKKLTSLIALLTLCVSGAWATVTMPTLTTDASNPVLYVIQSYRSYGFVQYADGTTLTQTLDYSNANTKFYFVPVNGTDYTAGVKIVSSVNGKQINEMADKTFLKSEDDPMPYNVFMSRSFSYKRKIGRAIKLLIKHF